MDLAQVINIVQQTYEDFADPVRASLMLVPISELGDPHAPQRLAASSFAEDLTSSERTEALMKGQEPREPTIADRDKAIRAYLTDLRNALDEL